MDLEIPNHLHDNLDDLPLAPEKEKAKKEWVTPYMSGLLGEKSFHPTEKLLLTHLPKRKYIVHFALLQFFMEMGAQVTRVHRIITFTQSAFFAPYIAYNSAQRQAATSNLAKEYYKLKNNSLYGKTMENVRGRMDLRLCQTREKFQTSSSKALCRGYKHFSEDLAGVELLKEEVELNKPIGAL